MQATTVSVAAPVPGELAAFLEGHPWPADWAALGRTLEWLWTFDLKTPPGALWERLSDTSAFNMRLGLPEMKFEEKNGRLYGSSKNLGMAQEWEEEPWEWVWGQGLSNARIYSRGLARLVRSRYELEATPSGGTRLRVYFGWIPRSALGRFLLKASTRWMRDSYARVLNEMDAEISGKTAVAAHGSVLTREQSQRIKTAMEKLQTLGVEHSLHKRLETLLIKGSEGDLARLRPKNLAARWHVKLASLIQLLLMATRQGVLRLTWDVVCPHCRGVRSEAASLGGLPQRGSCGSCGIDFDATDHRNLDVTFHMHPSLRQVTPRLYCAAEPGRKPHRLLQANLAPGERRMVRLSLPAEGDSVAFAHVHEHFQRVYEAVKAGDGAVVKTIGDACMVAFNEPHKAFRAALDIQRRFPEGGLRLRVTLHHGPCLAVNLNSQIDYFGGTVNYAAKMQSAAGAGEIVYSEEVAAQTGVREAMDEAGLTPDAFSFKHSWDKGESPCFRLKIS